MVSNNFMEIQMGGGSLNLEILRGGGVQAVLEIQVEEGVKNRSWRRRGVDFFWNNPLLISFVCLFVFFFFSQLASFPLVLLLWP